MTVQSFVLAGALLVAAVMPGVVGIAIAFLATGLVANIAQLIIPAASRLAPTGRAGSATGTLVGVLLIGIFGGRLFASVLVEPLGWRWVVVVFAGLVLAVIPLVRLALDADLPLQRSGSYGRLLLGTLALARRSAPLRQSSVMQFFLFAVFNSFWTVMVLHLTGPTFGWTVFGAGLFGILGLAAGAATPFVGRYIDRYGPLPVVGVSLVVLLAACISAVVDSHVIVAFAVTMFVATLANQCVQSANQSRAIAANPAAAAQANTLFMFCVFLGGSVGALLGPVAFGLGGMPLVALQAAALVAVAAVFWLLAIRSSPVHTARGAS